MKKLLRFVLESYVEIESRVSVSLEVHETIKGKNLKERASIEESLRTLVEGWKIE